MSHLHRLTVPSFAISILAASLLGPPAYAAVGAADKCESSKAKAAGKYASCRLKAEARAVKKAEPADHAKCVEKLGGAWTKAETKAEGSCPSSGDLAEVEADSAVHTDSIANALAGSPSTVKCSAKKLVAAGKYPQCRLTAVAKAVKKGVSPDFTKCESKFLGGWAKIESKFTPATCPTFGDGAAIEAETTSHTDSVASKLTGASTPVPGCGNGVGECESAVDCAAGEVCSVCCTCVDEQCPDVMEWQTHAATGTPAGATELDWGWSGLMHDQDLADKSLLSLKLCSHAGSGPAACGEATVGGVDPSAGNCRCAGDNRTICDEPFESDDDDCGGGDCVCYMAPPEPYFVGNPACLLRRLDADVSGVWNVDSGTGALAVPLEYDMRVGGPFNHEPCPTCVNDPVANDRVRGGTCNGGTNDGQSCDANSSDATFPVPDGGDYSYDCFPSGALLTGSGLIAYHLLTTGGASLDPPTIECGFSFAPEVCPCGVCAGDQSLPCASNADCAALGPCAKQGDGAPRPNACSDSICTPTGGGEGECNTGPDDSYCDGALHANGDPLISCMSNADCGVTFIPEIDGGECTISVRRRCFPDPIQATGTAHPITPAAVATYCTAATSSQVANTTLGLPSPARVAISATSTFRCAGDAGSTYPGCP